MEFPHSIQVGGDHGSFFKGQKVRHLYTFTQPQKSG
jgi:hypothetical protein